MTSRTSRLIALIALLHVSTTANCTSIDPPTAQVQPPGDVQGWTDQDRQEWYHTSAGTWLIPYDWFVALQDEPLTARFTATGILADPTHPDRLPVGIAKTESPNLPTPVPFLGLNCAFCHTTQFTYRGATHRIEGGPSLQFNARFLRTLFEAVADATTPQHFVTFATKVLRQRGQEVTPDTLKAFRNEVTGIMSSLIDRAGRDISPETWGPGRFDALGRGGNTVFTPLSSDNLRPANAPVSIPALWGVWEYDRVQWSGSIEHPLARNIAQVIGVNAGLFAWARTPQPPPTSDADTFRSTVDVHTLKTLEQLARRLLPPRWPSAFPPINPDLAARGRDLYHGNPGKQIPNLCAHCHLGTPIDAQGPAGPSRHVHLIEQKEVGTDDLYLENFSRRLVDLRPLGRGLVSAREASELVTTELLKVHRVSDDPEYGHRTNTWIDEAKYIARPHLAVWATAPFLHNGSIPNLYELLSPVEERHDCFYLSPNMEFDPRHVGYAVADCSDPPTSRDPLAGFAFNTHLPGNKNIGHEFRDDPTCAREQGKRGGVLGCAISQDDRLAIIEYLKTCDLERFVLKDPPPCRDLTSP